MLVGVALTVAAFSLLLALLALLGALILVGKVKQQQTTFDTLQVKLAALDGHRVRMDGNTMVLAQHIGLLAKVNGVPLAPQPVRPQ